MEEGIRDILDHSEGGEEGKEGEEGGEGGEKEDGGEEGKEGGGEEEEWKTSGFNFVDCAETDCRRMTRLEELEKTNEILLSNFNPQSGIGPTRRYIRDFI